MGNDYVMDIAGQAFKVSMMLAAPALLSALVIGVLVSLFQAVTQINEQTLSFIPKIVAIAGVMLLAGPWMIDLMTGFTKYLILSIPSVVMIK